MVDKGHGNIPTRNKRGGQGSEEEDSGVSSSSDESVPVASKRRARPLFNGVEITKRP